MENDLDLFISDFNKVRNSGFIKSKRSNSTGIGKTFEDAIGVIENNSKEPDLHGFEIKSQRSLSGSYVTLFTKSPTMPKCANTYLRMNYGSYDNQYPDIKVLHTSIFHGHYNTHVAGAEFSLKINREERRLYILVKRIDGSIDDTIYYSFDNIKKALKKLEKLAFISADTRKNANNEEEFHFKKATIFYNFISFENFLNLLEEGLIMYDVRIGAYKTGQNKGKTHDHGSGFRIKKNDIQKLYERSLSI